MSSRRRFRRCTAIALAAFGLAVPAAQARPIDPPLGQSGASHADHSRPLSSADRYHLGIAPRPQITSDYVATSRPVVKLQPADSGIDWGSLGLGAAGFSAVVAAFAGANAAIARRRRVHPVR